MVDVFDMVDSPQITRMREARYLERAIQRTERLLLSPMASADPSLRKKWEQKRRRQGEQLIRLCK